MKISRRTLMAGLAATLSVFRIPRVSALEETYKIEDEFDDYDYYPPIQYLEVGECEYMLGGPATEAGWYLHPLCAPGCCASEGPFPSREAAVEADRIRWKQIAESSVKRSTDEADREEFRRIMKEGF